MEVTPPGGGGNLWVWGGQGGNGEIQGWCPPGLHTEAGGHTHPKPPSMNNMGGLWVWNRDREGDLEGRGWGALGSRAGLGLGVSAHLVSTVKWLAVPTRPPSRPGPCARTRVGSQPSATPTRNGLLGTGTSSYVTSTRCSPTTGTPSHTIHGWGTRGLWGVGWEFSGDFGGHWVEFGRSWGLWGSLDEVLGGGWESLVGIWGLGVPGSGDHGEIEAGPHLDVVWQGPSLRVPHEDGGCLARTWSLGDVLGSGVRTESLGVLMVPGGSWSVLVFPRGWGSLGVWESPGGVCVLQGGLGVPSSVGVPRGVVGVPHPPQRVCTPRGRCHRQGQ